MPFGMRIRGGAGDVILSTGPIRDFVLHTGEPVHVISSFSDIWLGNPYVHHLDSHMPPDLRQVRLDYRYARSNAKSGRHISKFYHEEIQRCTGVRFPATKPEPDLHVNSAELPTAIAERLPKRFVLVVAGGKADMPVKAWHEARYQQVIDTLAAQGIPVVQAGARFPRHWQPQLKNVIDLCGQTSMADFLRIVALSSCVVCGVSMPLCAAAGLRKPCVVIAGGREAPDFYRFTRNNPGLLKAELLEVPHRILHSMGTLKCCNMRPCYVTHLIPDRVGQRGCLDIVAHKDEPEARCLANIKAETVVAEVISCLAETA